MSEDRPNLPDRQADSWEASIEAELAALRREVERLATLTTKHGSYIKLLMTERDERQRHAKQGARR